MILEKEKNELQKLIDEKVRETKKHNDLIKEIELQLIGLKKATEEALDSGDDELYVKLGGQVAVAEARLKKLHAESGFLISKELIKNLKEDICRTYEREVSKKASKILKACDDMLKAKDEIEEMYDELSEIIFMYEALTESDASDMHRDDASDIRDMGAYMEKVIDPFTDSCNGRSIRAYAMRIDYSEK